MLQTIIPQLMELRDHQLQHWPLARQNYEALGHTSRKTVMIGPMQGAIQYNPSRKVSTGAAVDAASVAARPCFLCRANRPAEQLTEEIIPGWEFLVNPYPIFPLHFTIASSAHIPQSRIPLDMVLLAERLPGMTVFFNGARAGASAPDHQHCQAVMTSELPLMNYLEKGGDPDSLPFKVDYRIIAPDMQGMADIAAVVSLAGCDASTGEADYGLLNAYMWIGDDGLLRTAVVLRSAHRPACYSRDASEGYMVSPGAIDMAGVFILPVEENFNSITQADIDSILHEVAIKPDSQN